MRTVTFSNAAVMWALKDDFICTWVNREPGFHNCDNSAERWIIQTDAFATKNFCTFFTTPDLDVLHYASGYFRPEWFLEELKVVAALKRSVLDLRNRFMEDAAPEFRDAHMKHAEAHDLERAPKSGGKWQEQREETGDSRHRREGLLHLSAVHKDLVDKIEKAKGPVPLSEVYTRYLFGNSFQETKRDSRREPDRGPGM